MFNLEPGDNYIGDGFFVGRFEVDQYFTAQGDDIYVGHESYSGSGFYIGEEFYQPVTIVAPSPDLQLIKLPVWLNRGTAKSIALFLESWWFKVKDWIFSPLSQIDPLTASIRSVDLLAYQRNVKRLNNENETSYRLRVSNAFVNAKDAGSVSGFKRIFQRLGVGLVGVADRVAGKDWDVVVLTLTDQQYSDHQNLVELIIDKYGRTCRRYEYELNGNFDLGVSAHEFDHTWFNDYAE